MIKLLLDQNFNDVIRRGILRRSPEIDLIRLQDTEISDADDPTVLAWAAKEQRVVITHDVATMTAFAYDRVRAGLPMPGVFEVVRAVPLHQAIEDLVLIAECSNEGEWEGQVRYLPLR